MKHHILIHIKLLYKKNAQTILLIMPSIITNSTVFFTSCLHTPSRVIHTLVWLYVSLWTVYNVSTYYWITCTSFASNINILFLVLFRFINNLIDFNQSSLFLFWYWEIKPSSLLGNIVFMTNVWIIFFSSMITLLDPSFNQITFSIHCIPVNPLIGHRISPIISFIYDIILISSL